MRGHDHIIQMRLRGFRPESVMVWDQPIKVREPQWVEDYRYMDVCTDGDNIPALDLRFLVGLHVTVLGDNSNRVKQIALQCKQSGAEAVVAQSKDRFAMWTKRAGKWLSF